MDRAIRSRGCIKGLPNGLAPLTVAQSSHSCRRSASAAPGVLHSASSVQPQHLGPARARPCAYAWCSIKVEGMRLCEKHGTRRLWPYRASGVIQCATTTTLSLECNVSHPYSRIWALCRSIVLFTFPPLLLLNAPSSS